MSFQCSSEQRIHIDFDSPKSQWGTFFYLIEHLGMNWQKVFEMPQGFIEMRAGCLRVTLGDGESFCQKEFSFETRTLKWLRLHVCIAEERFVLNNHEIDLRFVRLKKVEWVEFGRFSGYFTCDSIVPPKYPPEYEFERSKRTCDAMTLKQALTVDLSFVCLEERKRLDDFPHGLMLCHDMKGGYIATDSSIDTVYHPVEEQAFVFKHWDVVSSFIYFSHHPVTIPPRAWIDCCKTNKVVILGTVITEHVEGLLNNAVLLRDPKASAVALAKLAKFHGFDGWLINIEAPVEGMVDKLDTFLRSLRSYCFVVMYDSIARSTGQLWWQNTVNEENCGFLDVCDAFFLNYWWKPENLPSSGSRQTYCGIDVFGRGTYGGGGFSCATAMQAANEKGLSTALFAPGWYVECSQHDYMELQFWRGTTKRDFKVTAETFRLHLEELFGVKKGEQLHGGQLRFQGRLIFARFEGIRGILRIIVTRKVKGTPKMAAVAPFAMTVTVNKALEVPAVFDAHNAVLRAEIVLVLTNDKRDCALSSLDLSISGATVSKMASDGCRVSKHVTLEVLNNTLNDGKSLYDCCSKKEAMSIETLPFQTSFCTGNGKKMYVNGKVWKNSAWTNLSFQSRLNSELWEQDSLALFDLETSFNFGSNLRILCSDSAVKIPFARLKQGLSPTGAVLVFCGDSVVLNASVGRSLVIDERQENGWTVQRLKLEDMSGVLSFSSEGESFVGYFCLFSQTPAMCVAKIVTERRIILSREEDELLLDWNIENEDCCFCVDVYLNGQFQERQSSKKHGSIVLRIAKDMRAEYQIIPRSMLL